MFRFFRIITLLFGYTLIRRSHFWRNVVVATATSRRSVETDDSLVSIVEYLRLGDDALIHDDMVTAIKQYERGLQQYVHVASSSSSSQEELHQISNESVDDTMNDDTLSTIVSLYTNLGTAHSTRGDTDHAIQSYRNAIEVYQKYALIDDSNKPSNNIDHQSYAIATKYYESQLITAQASFFLGMVFQDMVDQAQEQQLQSSLSPLAIESYRYATQLDPNHWSSYSNLGAVYQDQSQDHRNALIAYNQAYRLLSDPSTIQDVTDPPVEASFILSELQYRIGLCLSHDLANNFCAVAQSHTDGNSNAEPGNCLELATHAFALAIEHDTTNESAKHMLASLTADATMHRASNEYVKALFDQYAKNFEYSLVKELRYTGFERLRRGFDRAFTSSNNSTASFTTPKFDLVVDAGCGTGLVGEQFRNISNVLIGVDLSEVIIEKAVQTRPKLYDEVQVGDIITIFHSRKSTISLIIAGDSFIYFGNLDPLFASISEGLIVGGYIAFTLENVDIDNERVLEVTNSDWRWQLTASGRFAHRKEYIVRTAHDHGLEMIHYESMDGFRFEHRVEVRGHLFVMMKKVDSTDKSPDQEL